MAGSRSASPERAAILVATRARPAAVADRAGAVYGLGAVAGSAGTCLGRQPRPTPTGDDDGVRARRTWRGPWPGLLGRSVRGGRRRGPGCGAFFGPAGNLAPPAQDRAVMAGRRLRASSPWHGAEILSLANGRSSTARYAAGSRSLTSWPGHEGGPLRRASMNPRLHPQLRARPGNREEASTWWVSLMAGGRRRDRGARRKCYGGPARRPRKPGRQGTPRTGAPDRTDQGAPVRCGSWSLTPSGPERSHRLAFNRPLAQPGRRRADPAVRGAR